MKTDLSLPSFGLGSVARLGRILVTAIALLAVPVAGFAQDTSSAIRGRITDESGNPAANMNVVVEDLRTGIERRYTSNASGAFFASRLPVGGPYMVTVEGAEPVLVDSIDLGDIYNLSINLTGTAMIEEIVVTGTVAEIADVAPGPSSVFSSYDLETAVAFERDIKEIYAIDPRLNLDVDGFQVNCGGQHPRFNSITLDGVSQNDRFGLNTNGYSTATGMPFPYDAIEQVQVELAPFDVTYGGFSACNINAVTKSGTNEFQFGGFYDYTSDDYRGDKIGNDSFTSLPYTEERWGAHVGGPIIQDRLFFFAAYETAEEPRFLAGGYAGSGNGEERPWLSESDFNRIVDIARNVYNYDPGQQPQDGAQVNDKYMLRLDWNISDQHNAALTYNYFDGFQDRASDNDSDEFEFTNHFYTKGAESETITLQLNSQWTDAFSTQIYYSTSEMNDSQVTNGPKDFGDFQISVGGFDGVVYLGADDSRQANSLSYDSDFLKLIGQYLVGDHVITAGYEREELNIFNIFVQHSRGGEYDFFDDSTSNPAACDALTAQQRLDDSNLPDGDPGKIGCEPSGIDRFELGRPSRIFYGSGGGTNVATDAAASFSNTLHSFYIQDEMFFDQYDLTVIAGFRYETFTSDDRPNFNQTFTAANGVANDANIDGLSLIMPRLGFTWGARDNLSLRGGIGLYSGGNPNVWISNAWSNDGLTNAQFQFDYFDAATVLPGSPDSLVLSGAGRPGYNVPQEMVDAVLAVSPEDANDSNIVLLDPNYKQPAQWKFALGATWDLPWQDITMDFDVLYSRMVDPAYYVDVSQDNVGSTSLGQPIYAYARGENNFMLTNSSENPTSTMLSFMLTKNWDWGLDFTFGYAYTDAEDVSPMTSFVAGSNFDNLALLDINNPRPGLSDYVVPHRFTMRASYAREFFGDNTTRFTLYGFVQEGQPQSYTMGMDGGLEGEDRNSRHLLYIPDGPSDPNVIFGDDFQTQAFFDWAAAKGFGPGFVPRNVEHAKWSSRVDFSISQDIPTWDPEFKGRAFVKIYNLANMLNDDWGKQWNNQFSSRRIVDGSIDAATGQYVYEDFSARDVNDLVEVRSLWEVRLGIQFSFR